MPTIKGGDCTSQKLPHTLIQCEPRQRVSHKAYQYLACAAWRFCRAGRRSSVAAKFAREARENERQSREKNKNRFSKLLPPQSPRDFSALARLYYLARPTKTAMLRRLISIQQFSEKNRKYQINFLCGRFHQSRQARRGE